MGISPRQLDAILGRRRYSPGSGARLLTVDRVLEGRRRLEDLIDAARTGSRSALKQLGLELTPEVLEALWEFGPPTATKIADRPRGRVLGSSSLWRSGQPLPADPVAYVSRVVRRRAKELEVLYGSRYELSPLDLPEFEVDHRKAARLEKGVTWKRAQRVELDEQSEAVTEMGEPSAFARDRLLSVAMSDRVRRMVELMDSGLTSDEARREAGVSGRELKAFLSRVKALRLR